MVCELGGFSGHIHFPACDVRMAAGPGVRAQGSEHGHGYGWFKRQKNLGAQALRGRTEGQGSGATNGSGFEEYSDYVRDNAPVHARFGTRPIGQYREPSDVEGPDGTQDSTARSIFP